MVAVTHAAPQAAAPQAVGAWLESLASVYADADRKRFAAAYEMTRNSVGAAQSADGEPLLGRALGTASILAAQRLDADSVTASLLLGLPQTGAHDTKRVEAAFGPDVAALVAGVSRMDAVRALATGGDAEQRAEQAENLRMMLLAMVDDIRVVLIKLAERTQALRYLMSSGRSAAREPDVTSAAREVMDVYAPLANRLGLWQLKWELEDLSLRALEPGEFDDYIAKPKANNYRSLHTAVLGPEGKPLEVQIRTREMHRHSEYGVAAHWRYKEGDARGERADARFDDKIAWLRQILDWKDAVADTGEWLSAFRSSLFTDSIYVLTPQGKVVDLPRGATPIDFAYAVHTSLGHRCRGARVDGQMVPLDYVLKNGQQVEIIAAKQGAPASGPSRDWLNSDLGYVQSHRARAKVRQWFKAQQHDDTVAQGRAMVERELARLGQTALKLDAVAAKAGFARTDELFAAFARDEINSKQVQTAIHAVTQPVAPQAAPQPEVVTRRSRARGGGHGILVVGVDRLLTGLARCCKPAPPDPVVGFVTRGKGITIHRASCPNVGRIRAREPERLIEATWGAPREEVFPVDIVVEASDRQGLLRDLSELLSREKINVTAVNTQTRQHQARMAFTLEVENLAQLRRALQMARDIPGVFSADRR